MAVAASTVAVGIAASADAAEVVVVAEAAVVAGRAHQPNDWEGRLPHAAAASVVVVVVVVQHSEAAEALFQM